MSSLLLHTCCAPCSIVIIDELRHTHELTVFFHNPNIYPTAEYEKRKAEVVRLCTEWGVPMVDVDYRPEDWEAACGGMPDSPEGGPRCSKCIRLRLDAAARYAKDNGFDTFATSLSSGRQKKTEVINAIGQAVSLTVQIPYLAENWKRGGRQEKSRAMIAERKIYRQDYCGCRFSLENRDRRLNEQD